MEHNTESVVLSCSLRCLLFELFLAIRLDHRMPALGRSSGERTNSRTGENRENRAARASYGNLATDGTQHGIRRILLFPLLSPVRIVSCHPSRSSHPRVDLRNKVRNGLVQV